MKNLDFILKSRVKIAPKYTKPETNPEISFDDAEILGWTLVPQEQKDE